VTLSLDDLLRRVVDQLNEGHPANDRSRLVTQTVYTTVAVLKADGFIDTEREAR